MINEILNKKGIELSKDENFTFEIDFYNYIHVSGQDEKKAKAIERALNESDLKLSNGLSLAGHISSSIPAGRGHFLGENYYTFRSVGNYARKYLGTELENLILDGNKIYTPDGVLLEKALKNYETVKNMNKVAPLVARLMVESITKALELGIDKATATSIKIDFRNGSLMDAYTPQYGYGKGQTEWAEKYNTNHFSREEIWVHNKSIIEFQLSFSK